MIVFSVNDDGKVAFVHDIQPGEKPVDVTDKWVCNQLTVQDNDGKMFAGFHFGQDVTDQVVTAVAAEEEPDISDRFLGDGK